MAIEENILMTPIEQPTIDVTQQPLAPITQVEQMPGEISCTLDQSDKQSGMNLQMSSVSKAVIVALIALIILLIIF